MAKTERSTERAVKIKLACGCMVRRSPYGVYELLECSLHTAAPAVRDALQRVLDEGSYDDNGDYVLLRPGDEDQAGDYEEPPAIAHARAVLDTITRAEV